MSDRRDFLKNLTAATAASSLLTHRAQGQSAPEPPGRRRRRIIYNNDGGDLSKVALDFPRPGWPQQFESVEQFLSRRMEGLRGTQVDSVSYCAFLDLANWEFPPDNIRALGPDPLKHVVDFCHANGMEFLYSMRMNDVHAAVYPGEKYWSRFKLEHLDLLQARLSPEAFDQDFLPWIQKKKPEHPFEDLLEYWGYTEGGRLIDQFRNSALGPLAFSWPAFDFAHAEVRKHYLGVIDEACRRYDLDGFELDWGRHPLVFRYGEERQNTPIMNDFIRQIQQRLQAYGKKRGRPILLATRVPDSPELSRSVGLDAETWMGEGWIDLLIAGFGSAPFTFPLEDWVRLGRQHDVPVYGGLSWMHIFEKLEAIRGAAYRCWEAGVDGIYFFNLLRSTYYGCLQEIGDPKILAQQDKLYRIDPNRKKVDYMNSSTWPGQLPLALTCQSGPARARLTLGIADRPESARKVTLQTGWERGVNAKRIRWKINGVPLSGGRELPTPVDGKEDRWTEFETESVRKGSNTFEVMVNPPLQGDPAEPAVLNQLRVNVSYSS